MTKPVLAERRFRKRDPYSFAALAPPPQPVSNWAVAAVTLVAVGTLGGIGVLLERLLVVPKLCATDLTVLPSDEGLVVTQSGVEGERTTTDQYAATATSAPELRVVIGHTVPSRLAFRHETCGRPEDVQIDLSKNNLTESEFYVGSVVVHLRSSMWQEGCCLDIVPENASLRSGGECRVAFAALCGQPSFAAHTPATPPAPPKTPAGYPTPPPFPPGDPTAPPRPNRPPWPHEVCKLPTRTPTTQAHYTPQSHTLRTIPATLALAMSLNLACSYPGRARSVSNSRFRRADFLSSLSNSACFAIFASSDSPASCACRLVFHCCLVLSDAASRASCVANCCFVLSDAAARASGRRWYSVFLRSLSVRCSSVSLARCCLVFSDAAARASGRRMTSVDRFI